MTNGQRTKLGKHQPSNSYNQYKIFQSNPNQVSERLIRRTLQVIEERNWGRFQKMEISPMLMDLKDLHSKKSLPPKYF